MTGLGILLAVGGGEYGGRGGIDWEFEIEHVHPAIVKIDNQQDPTVKKNK